MPRTPYWASNEETIASRHLVKDSGTFFENPLTCFSFSLINNSVAKRTTVMMMGMAMTTYIIEVYWLVYWIVTTVGPSTEMGDVADEEVITYS